MHGNSLNNLTGRTNTSLRALNDGKYTYTFTTHYSSSTHLWSQFQVLNRTPDGFTPYGVLVAAMTHDTHTHM